MPYVPLQQAMQSYLGTGTPTASSGGKVTSSGPKVSSGYVPLKQAMDVYLHTNTGTKPKPVISSTQQKPVDPYSKISPLAKAEKGIIDNINKLPEAHFADKLNFFTPIGFVANLAQGLINTPAQALKGAASLGTHIGQGNTKPQQALGDLAAMAQAPLLVLTGGGSSIVKEGAAATGKAVFKEAAKGVAKAAGKGIVEGGAFGLLGGLQSGKEINTLDEYLKNLFKNVGIGAVAGGGIAGVTHVAIPLAKGLSSQVGAIFVKNVDKTPSIEHIQLDPKVAQSAILGHEGASTTPIGKEILKKSIVAADTEQQVRITLNPKGEFKSPTGDRVDVTVAPVYDPKTADIPQESRTNFVYKPADKLSPQERQIEANFGTKINSNVDAAMKEYQDKFGNVLNTDNARELSPQYSASNDTRSKFSAAVHEPASQLIKDIYKQKLAEPTPEGMHNTVLFTGGGTGAGKTSGLEGVVNVKDYPIVYDTNMNTFESAKTKIDQALNAGKDVSIVYVYRDPVEAMQNGALPRAMRMGRTVPVDEHIKTHLGAAETAIKLADAYKGNDRVQIQVIDNSLGAGKAQVSGIDVFKKNIYTKDELAAKLHETLKQQYEQGKISKQVYEGTLGNQNADVSQGANIEHGAKNGSKSSQNQVNSPSNPVDSNGKLRESQAFSKFVDSLKEADPKRYEELSNGKVTYNRLNLEADAKNAMKLVQEDPQRAYRIAKGLEAAPRDQTETAISIALADRAAKEGNFAKQAELESSRSLRQTRRGQEIVSERGRFNDNSPYKYIQEVIDTRMKELGKSLTNNLKDELPGEKMSRKKAAVAIVDKEAEKLKKILVKEQRKVKLAQSILDELTCK